ncbi:cytochrome b-c1 complex subunit 10 [Crucibulum laeve]|uniref:Cytochrome b-c1 complex subunit 10 n=1 Tax=Crucibulum laeve TaxID=68775 RepID=A0A5C3MDA0_9AGAR|nr:cytochrome b-c1 complex subunit 10 [Crucibulum laeve]
MARLSYHSQSPLNASLTASKRWVTSLGIWGVGAGTAALFLLSVTPLVKREFLSKVPALGSYYEDKTPASDKPF